MDFLQIYGKNGNYEFGILYRIFDKIWTSVDMKQQQSMRT